MEAISIAYKACTDGRRPARPIKSLLHAVDGELGAIVRQAGQLEALRKVVLEVLPETAADHVHVAGLDHGRLLMHVDSAGWATRLRYAEPSIRRALAQRLRLHADNIVTRVRPALAQATRPVVERRISAANRDHMRRVAAYIDHPRLAQTLLRLAGGTDEPYQAAATGRALT